MRRTKPPSGRRPSLRDKVLANARKAVRSDRHVGWKLNQAISFDPDLSLRDPESVGAFLDQLFAGRTIYKRGEWVEALVSVLANLADARQVVRLSHNAEERKSPKRYGHPSQRMIVTVVDRLHEDGFIEKKPGIHTESWSRQTRIWALPRLLEDMPELHHGIVRRPSELVELREFPRIERVKRRVWDPKRRRYTSETQKKRITGRLLDYKDTAQTRRTRRVLEHANAVNAPAAILYRNEYGELFTLAPAIKAIFVGKLTLYGRLHTMGGRYSLSHQGLPAAEREHITIDGEPVVELDFSGLHPRLLYAHEGIQYDNDPYTAVSERLIDNAPLAGEALRHLRDYEKMALLALLNSRDWRQAEACCNDWFRTEPRDSVGAVRQIGITRARPVLEAFHAAHKPIAHYFHSGVGLRVMNLDARIALDIVNHFARQGAPILPVHDSFLVQARYQDELRHVMNQAYAHHTGGFTCPIKP